MIIGVLIYFSRRLSGGATKGQGVCPIIFVDSNIQICAALLIIIN